MTSLALYIGAAIAEIGGCFAFWAWLRLDKSVYWIFPRIISLIAFAFLLTRIETLFAGRTFAAYGGIYIVASLLWLWTIEGQRPDKWDILGSIICITGAVVILFGQRQQI
jgi:small multidrug resistance family-3 protein